MSRRETPGPGFNRWLLFALLAAAGILALVDRQIIAVLKPAIAKDLRWSDDDYGTLGATFQGAFAAALLVAGPLADRLGVKWANALGVFGWSVAALCHGWASSLLAFTLCRAGLGGAEALAAPTNVKTIAAIFPPALRSTGFGLSNAVSSLGAICAPLLIPLSPWRLAGAGPSWRAGRRASSGQAPGCWRPAGSGSMTRRPRRLPRWRRGCATAHSTPCGAHRLPQGKKGRRDGARSSATVRPGPWPAGRC